jgi:hypothetical protein
MAREGPFILWGYELVAQTLAITSEAERPLSFRQTTLGKSIMDHSQGRPRTEV